MKRINFWSLIVAASVLAVPAGCGDDETTDNGPKLTSLTLDQESVTIKKDGGTYQIVATTDPADFALKYTSSDASIAAVSEAGLVTAAAAGTATITVSPYNADEPSATLSVTVADLINLAQKGAYIVAVPDSAYDPVVTLTGTYDASKGGHTNGDPCVQVRGFATLFDVTDYASLTYEIEDPELAEYTGGKLKAKGTAKGKTNLRAKTATAISEWVPLYVNYNDQIEYHLSGEVAYEKDLTADFKLVPIADAGITVSDVDPAYDSLPCLVDGVRGVNGVGTYKGAANANQRWVAETAGTAGHWILLDLKSEKEFYKLAFEKASNTSIVKVYVSNSTAVGSLTGEGFEKIDEFDFSGYLYQRAEGLVAGNYTASPHMVRSIHTSARYILLVIYDTLAAVAGETTDGGARAQLRQVDLYTLPQ